MLTKRANRVSGSSTILFVACLMIITVVGVACMAMIMMLGGHRELQSSIDASALATAKQGLMIPAQAVSAFPNPDVEINFGALGCAPGPPTPIGSTGTGTTGTGTPGTGTPGTGTPGTGTPGTGTPGTGTTGSPG